MRRILVLLVCVLAGCDDARVVEWSDEPGIEVCEAIVDGCGDLCADDRAQGNRTCSAELYDVCVDHVQDSEGLVDRVPGLHARLTEPVVMQWEPDCTTALGFLPAWRYDG